MRLPGALAAGARGGSPSSLNCVSTLNQAVQSVDPWQDEPDPGAAPLTPAQARDLLRRKPQVSLWRVVGLQAAVGLVVAAASWFVGGGRPAVALSALYGAGMIVLPSALFAGGIRLWLSRLKPGIAVYGFAFGELLKIALTVGLLLLAPRVVQPLSWAALLVALVLTLQVYWIALLLRGKSCAAG